MNDRSHEKSLEKPSARGLSGCGCPPARGQGGAPKRRLVGLVVKTALAALAVAAIAVAAWRFDLQAAVRHALGRISGLGPLGFPIFIGLYIVACVVLLPASILTLGAGALFGVVKGSITVSIAAALGASLAFLVGRHVAREWVARQIAGNPKFKAIDEAVAREGWKIVLFTRLSPIFPFNLLNYAFGLTNVSLRDYFFASWLGMIPATITYVYIGSLAGNLARVGAGGRAPTTGEWVLYAVGLAATVAVTVFVTRLARKALAERI